MNDHFEHAFASLNTEQRTAVIHDVGPMLVIAGAGSGKTKVATMRAAYLIQQGVPAASIVGVTFTNKAARQMRERVQTLVGSDVLVSTFHSLGARILRESIGFLEYPTNFSIYDENESEKTLKDCLKDQGLQPSAAMIATFKTAISQIKNNPAHLQFVDQATRSCFTDYQRRLKQSGAVDFDDLIYLPIELFKTFPTILDRYIERWKYLMVDEYQDTSDSQSTFAAFLAGPNNNIFAVGDPDQSIYSWRGAQVTNILSFQETFPTARIVRLEQNYRSTNTILAASNAVIGCNEARYDKRLWSQRGQGEPIERYIAKSERSEADFVSSSIHDLVQRGLPYDHIAILYRTNAQSRALEDSCMSERIPYRIWGGTPFYSRKEIRDLLSFIQIAASPSNIAAFERAITVLGCGIGEASLNKLRTEALAQECAIFDVAQRNTVVLPKKQTEGLQRFCRLVSDLQTIITQASAYEALIFGIEQSGYMEQLHKDPESEQERKENIAQLLGRAREWDETHAGESPLIFLEELILEGNKEHDHQLGPCVTLATIHNAKGLEFEVVFLVGLEEDLFPHINAKQNSDDIEEERRLFYVGMTRAKDKLFISAAQTRFVFGGARSMRISRFWKEIPQEYVRARSHLSYTPMPIQEVSTFVTEQFEVGEVVFHPQFGMGRIDHVSPNKDMYTIFFSGLQASKKLLASCAPLRRPGA